MKLALIVEGLKLRRSRVPLASALLMVVFFPVMVAGIYSVATDEGVGLIADKASVFLTLDGWRGYLALASQITAVAFMLGVGVVASWIFGREKVDGALPLLFARAIPLRSIAVAKYLAALAWMAVASIAISLTVLVAGLVVGIGPLGPEDVGDVIGLYLITLLAGLMGLTMGLPASLGGGYLAGIGAAITVVAAAQILVLFGAGGWFPYAIPGLLAVAREGVIRTPNANQIGLLGPTIVFAYWATIRAWSRYEVT